MASALTLVTAPAATAIVWTDEVESHLRLDGLTTEKARVEAIVIPAAVTWAETLTGRQLINATWRLDLDEFPDNDVPITIPRPPLSSITSIKYYDTDGVLQTWASTKYVVHAPAGPKCLAGSVRPVYGQSYPTTRDERADAVQITFVAGYGTASTNVPALLRAAMLLVVGEMFERREQAVVGSISDVPLAAINLAMPFLAESP